MRLADQTNQRVALPRLRTGDGFARAAREFDRSIGRERFHTIGGIGGALGACTMEIAPRLRTGDGFARAARELDRPVGRERLHAIGGAGGALGVRMMEIAPRLRAGDGFARAARELGRPIGRKRFHAIGEIGGTFIREIGLRQGISRGRGAQCERVRGIEIGVQANFAALNTLADLHAQMIRARGIDQPRVAYAGEIALGKAAAVEHLPERLNRRFVRRNRVIERGAICAHHRGHVFWPLQTALDLETRHARVGQLVQPVDGAQVARGE